MSEAIAVKPRNNSLINVDMTDLSAVASLIFNSKIFGDIQTKEAAAIKILAGMEYGFEPLQAMSMFDFIQGRPVLNAHGKATLINSSGDFRMHTKSLTPKECIIDVLRKNDQDEWKVIATRTFTWQDAVDAEYTSGKNAHSYKKTPRNMLFARNVSNIWRWDCAELNTRDWSSAQIQEFETPAEIEAEAGGEPQPEAPPVDENVIEGEIVETDPEPIDGTPEPEIAADGEDGPSVVEKLRDQIKAVVEEKGFFQLSKKTRDEIDKTPIDTCDDPARLTELLTLVSK